MIHRLRFALAKKIAGQPIFHSWGLARYDRIYTDRYGNRIILDGSQGHSSSRGFHHGGRSGCPVCADMILQDTSDLPRRFREPAAPPSKKVAP